MTKLGTITIYHETDDKRIIAYLNKNIATHSLQQPVKGNGNIRAAIGLIACIGVFTLLAIGWAA